MSCLALSLTSPTYRLPLNVGRASNAVLADFFNVAHHSFQTNPASDLTLTLTLPIWKGGGGDGSAKGESHGSEACFDFDGRFLTASVGRKASLEL